MLNIFFITASMKRLKSTQKIVIIILKEKNYSGREVKKRIRCSHVSIPKFYKLYDATKSLERAPGSGFAKKKTSTRMDRN